MITRPCVSFPGYCASDDGRIFTYGSPAEVEYVRTEGLRAELRCAMAEVPIRPNGHGYLLFSAYWRAAAKGKSNAVGVHIAVADAFLGPKPRGLIVRHLNDIRQDNRATNLAYGTYADNTRDAMVNGRFDPTANNRKNRRYTPEQINGIRRLRASGLSFGEISRMLNNTIRPAYLSQICGFALYADVPCDPELKTTLLALRDARCRADTEEILGLGL